jgi:hypothetical protein
MAEPDTREVDALSAKVLNKVAATSTTLPDLAKALDADPPLLDAAVQRLNDLHLIEISGDLIQGTSFVRRASGLFHFTS